MSNFFRICRGDLPVPPRHVCNFELPAHLTSVYLTLLTLWNQIGEQVLEVLLQVGPDKTDRDFNTTWISPRKFGEYARIHPDKRITKNAEQFLDTWGMFCSAVRDHYEVTGMIFPRDPQEN